MIVGDYNARKAHPVPSGFKCFKCGRPDSSPRANSNAEGFVRLDTRRSHLVATQRRIARLFADDRLLIL